MKRRKVKAKIKRKFYNIAICFFSFSFILLGVMVSYRHYQLYKHNNAALSVYDTFMSLDDIDGPEIDYDITDLKIGRFNVIGTIRIPSVGIQYPILEKTTPESLNLSITKLSGPELNEVGNVSLAGHHSSRGNLFAKLPLVKIGDTIQITDINKKEISYEVYRIYNVMPDDLEPVEVTDPDKREITLISCIQGGRKRIIVKAYEI